jgi:SAM-dependent methyltransferase
VATGSWGWACAALVLSAGQACSREPPAPAADVSGEPRKPDVLYVPTPQSIVDKMLELARVEGDDVVYDLGCGDGRIVVTAARRYGARAVGFDIDPVRVAEARANVRENGVERLVTIEQKDIFTLDLSPASVVTLYLLPSLNVQLIPQLQRMKPGSRVVSHDFDIMGVVPLQTLTSAPDDKGAPHTIYVFEIPLKEER